jgi:predicted dehydrogenase
MAVSQSWLGLALDQSIADDVMIQCAIAGLGRWGRSLVEAAQRGGRLKITHAVEPDAERARDFCAAHGLSLADTFEGVLANPAIEAVLLATPHSRHLPQVTAAASAGKQVFCEKPLALRPEHATSMFDACRSAGVVLAVGHNRRFWPSLQALREIVGSGELGTILHVEGHNSNENSQSITSGWRLSPEESPGGGLTGAGLHVLDAFVSLVGPARQVYARLSSREVGPPPLDSAMLAIEFANGVTGTLATIRATPFYWRVHAFGTKGSAEVLDEVTLVRRRSGTKPETIIYPIVDVLANELTAFADAVEGQQPFPIAQEQVLATLAAFDGALRSMRAGQPVTLDL